MCLWYYHRHTRCLWCYRCGLEVLYLLSKVNSTNAFPSIVHPFLRILSALLTTYAGSRHLINNRRCTVDLQTVSVGLSEKNNAQLIQLLGYNNAVAIF